MLDNHGGQLSPCELNLPHVPKTELLAVLWTKNPWHMLAASWRPYWFWENSQRTQPYQYSGKRKNERETIEPWHKNSIQQTQCFVYHCVPGPYRVNLLLLLSRIISGFPRWSQINLIVHSTICMVEAETDIGLVYRYYVRLPWV